MFYLLWLNYGQATNKVITMERLGRIRRMHLRDKVSLHEIARRTGGALFAQLKAAGYAGGYTRVTDFIRAWRAGSGKGVKAFVPLKSHMGEAFSLTGAEKAWWSEAFITACRSLI